MAGYGSDNDLSAWLAGIGYSLPEGSPEPAILRQRASDYIDGLYESRFIGTRTDPLEQERAWPRTGAVVQGVDVPTDSIPGTIERASYAAALYEAQNPGGLAVAVSAAAAVKREKVGPLEVEYVSGSGDVVADATVRLTAVEGLLAPFLRPESVAGLGIWAVG
jgi:hypothetical protein